MKNNILDQLSKSKFISSFYLKQKDIKYIYDKKIETIEIHIFDFVKKRLRYLRENDRKQITMK